MITGNKGEWSEIYVLFKLLGDKQLSLGNKDIEKLEDLVYPIIKVLRTENNDNFEYSIKDEIILISGNEEILKIPISEFRRKSPFSSKSISLKASSSTKTDITIVIHDQRTNQNPILGFSIKSQLGSPSTLLNAGKTTNFIYKIKGVNFTAKKIKEINSISTRSKIMDRVVQVLNKGGEFEFVKTERKIFSNNLVLIDSLLPDILSHIVFEFYSSGFSHLTDLVNSIAKRNPLNFDVENEHKFYEYKIKRFLTDVALGMMPSKVWTGQYDAKGGYLIIKENGDVLCYHIYNRNEFENYLLHSTKLETASSSKHGFGEIYQENEQLYFTLNLQIRFIK